MPPVDSLGRLRVYFDLDLAMSTGLTMLAAKNHKTKRDFLEALRAGNVPAITVYEAERQCQTVALLDEGRLVTQGAPADLKRDLRHDAVRIEWKSDPAAEVAEMQLWPGVGHVRLANRTTHVTVDHASAFLTRVFQHAGDRIHSVRVEESTLEDVYFQLVGKGITSPSDDHSAQESS